MPKKNLKTRNRAISIDSIYDMRTETNFNDPSMVLRLSEQKTPNRKDSVRVKMDLRDITELAIKMHKHLDHWQGSINVARNALKGEG